MMTASTTRIDGPTEPNATSSTALFDAPDAHATAAVREVTNSGDVDHSAAPKSAEPTEFEAAAALPQVLKIVGSVVAPTTLLTALLIYFGLMYAVAFYRYFNVNYTVLNLPAQDYLIVSEDGLMMPLIFTAAFTLLALWLYQHETLITKMRGIGPRVLVSTSAVAGLALVGLAMADSVFNVSVFPTNFLEARGLSLSMGVLLLGYTARLKRVITADQRPKQSLRRAPEAVIVAKWSAVFVLVSAGLFWAVGSYAIGVGEGHAQAVESFLPYSADVILYSEKSLNLQGPEAPGVQEVPCQNSDAAYRFRYNGLKLIPQSGNQYLFLPAGWTRTNGTAIIIPHNDKIRLQFSPPGQTRNSACGS